MQMISGDQHFIKIWIKITFIGYVKQIRISTPKIYEIHNVSIGVHAKSSNAAVRGELARYPLLVQSTKSMIKYCLRIAICHLAPWYTKVTLKSKHSFYASTVTVGWTELIIYYNITLLERLLKMKTMQSICI